MKKQVAGYCPAYGYSNVTAQAGGSSNLPSIFHHNPGGGVMVPLHTRPPSGLQLDVKGLPNAVPFLPTTPRERADRGGRRLSSSDSTADRIHQANRLHTSHSTRQESGRTNSQPAVPLRSLGEHRGNVQVGGASAALAPITRRLPSATAQGRMLHGALPPIGGGGEGLGSGSTSHMTMMTEEEEEESSFGRVEGEVGVASECTSDGSDTDSDDEVSLTNIVSLSVLYG